VRVSSAGPDAPARSARGERGFTIVELLVVVSLAAILVSIVSPSFRTSPSVQVYSMARLMATHLEMARTQALAERMAVEIVFDESASPGTYTAYVDHDRDGVISQVQAEITAFGNFGERELEGIVQFGRGNASVVPGDPSTDAITLTGNVLDLDVQGLPDPWGTMGTVYLVHRDDPNAVSAVSIASSGSFKAWRWSAAEGGWQ
jgi:prepilin-type N-terminal cleavage/methylation domain-containing protein